MAALRIVCSLGHPATHGLQVLAYCRHNQSSLKQLFS
jgi:hypothetical protein